MSDNLRHCEERSDEAIQNVATSWIASLRYTALAMTIALVTLTACKPDATPRARQAKDWVDKFYTRYQIRGGWFFFGSEAKDGNVLIYINIPDKQADQLMAMDETSQADLITHFACPPVSEDVWSILDVTGDVIVKARKDGNVFFTASCKTKKKEL